MDIERVGDLFLKVLIVLGTVLAIWILIRTRRRVRRLTAAFRNWAEIDRACDKAAELAIEAKGSQRYAAFEKHSRRYYRLRAQADAAWAEYMVAGE